jgi:small-conductance mechanosensitive channel
MADRFLFDILGVSVYLDEFLSIIGLTALIVGSYLAFNKYFLPYLRKREDISRSKERKGQILLLSLLFLLFVESIVLVLDIEILLFNKIAFSLIVEALILLVSVYLVLWLATNLFIHQYFIRREKKTSERIVQKKDTETIAINALRWLLFAIAVLILLQYIDWDYNFFRISSPKEGAPDVVIKLSSVIQTIIILLVSRLIVWVVTQILLHGYYNSRGIDPGIRYSINTLLAYFIYFIATLVALRNLGMNLGLLIGGAAALLVGIGLALQNTFADFFSGLILLFERPIAVGDYVFYDNKTVQVQQIGLRATKVKDRDSVNFIIPNSKLISDTVKNWSYDEKSVRYQVAVGVAYGSDTKLVEQLLMQAADEHPEVFKKPKPKVVFSNFGDSSLDFILNYYSRNIYNAEWVKSDLRFRIDELFRENNVTIPFPQRDIWIKK